MRQDSTQQTIYEMTKQTVCDIYNIMFPISLTLFKRISSSGNKKKKKKKF